MLEIVRKTGGAKRKSYFFRTALNRNNAYLSLMLMYTSSPTREIILISIFIAGERSRAVVASAARAVASLKESEFDVRFNPDVYSAGIKHAATPEQLAKQRHLVKEAAAFLLTTQIPAFVST